MSYKLFEYKKWKNDALNYWISIIDSTTYVNKDEMRNTIKNNLNMLYENIDNYITNYPNKRLLKHFVFIHHVMYIYNISGFFKKYTKFTPPELKPITEYLQYYTYVLPNYEQLFNIVDDEQNIGFGKVEVTDTYNNLLNDVSKLSEYDKEKLHNFISKASDILLNISFATKYGNIKFTINTSNAIMQQLSIPEYKRYAKLDKVLNDLNIQIPYYNS